jgi:cellulose synthase/poly-beta-1,6-N-acetylglucosamine synthase-like glycosyltransferase
MTATPFHGVSCGWRVGVVIPARNEAGTIGTCVNSVRAAAAASGLEHAVWIVLVADSCSDATAELARFAIGAQGQVVETRVRSAGAARRIGAKAVLDHFRCSDPRTIWLANTDADSCVCRDWLDVQLALANQGIVGVAGIVQLDPRRNAVAHEVHQRTYAIRADGTHSHVHGANIAFRADAYIDIGGWMDRALAEDHCLWGRLNSRGWRVSSPANSVVITSSRLQGRAAGGFADSLRARIDARHAAP